MAAALLVCLVILLAIAGHSDANYCVCNAGASDMALQKNIDYACGSGADCTAILQNGPCYNPNTVRDHCSYAVNSYYQRKGQIAGSCDFLGTAAVTPTAPSTASGCVYQSSPSTGGTTTPSNSPPTGGTPNAGSTMPGTVQGPPGLGLGPTGSGFSNTDNSASVKLSSQSITFVLVAFSLSLLSSGLMWSSI